ncbi:hypothetical protein SAMN05421640_1314 [Ekhidna lutea]|uniref:Uncharacterized protein n=1 Tax=Ekhidna lutea TaxID=447679 RepID=A0A239HH82_EKHLU|nr:hypothetical protein [Ekhidna lutea]SNS80727.1 hypothetical protein SAMN05421640_1314 [Ekhidna lutea]
MKLFATSLLLLFSVLSYSQYYTGYYLSDPQVHSFDHFKIKQAHGHTKIDGDLTIHAYLGHSELWEQTAHFVANDEERGKLIAEYSHGEEIISVHVLKFMWDGNEWEYILLGYHGEDKHRHFIVIEEIFNDESESELLEFHRFDWVKGHHLTISENK